MDSFKNIPPLLPQEILIPVPLENQALLESYLKNQTGATIKISIPKLKQKKQLLELCALNAEEALRLYWEENKEEEKVLQDLCELFSLERLPLRIECFDTSHLQKQSPVGAMVVYEKGHFVKADYRNYKLTGTDEYSQMREMLLRRAESFHKNPPPDLWLLDGGIAQINIAKEIAQSIGVQIDILGIAKEKLDSKAHRAKGASKDIIRDSNAQVYALSASDKRLWILQKIRDEAHKSAINFHRKCKQKEDMQVDLLQIKGIGTQKLKALLEYFGGFEEIKKVTLEARQSIEAGDSKNEIAQIIGNRTAKLVLQKFLGLEE